MTELEKTIVLALNSEQDANTHRYPVTIIYLTYHFIIIN